MLSFFKIGSKPVLLIILLYVLTSNFSCSNKSGKELNAFKAIDESLINSNKTIDQSTAVIYATLNQKLSDPATQHKAMIWEPKAANIRRYTTDLANFIEDIKKKLKMVAGYKNIGAQQLAEESNEKAVVHFFDEQKMGDTLYEKLITYKRQIVSIDMLVDSSTLQVLMQPIESFDQSGSPQHFTSTFFYDLPAAAALAALSNFENNARVSENRLINFCNNKVSSFIEGYSTFSAIIAQNTTSLKAGEEMVITAGVGSFSRASMPEVLVDGKKVDMGESATASYKFNAPTKRGKYIVPVSINFINQEGLKQSITKDVEYTVL